MRKLLASAALIALGTATGPVTAQEPVSLSGTITLGQPGIGITETVGECDTASDVQGLDGMWFAIEGHDAWSGRLELPAAETDADVYFYDAECSYIDYSDMAQNFIALGVEPVADNSEVGTVPEGAAFAVVNGFVGSQISFTLTLEPAAA
jgi:hypothetical protein